MIQLSNLYELKRLAIFIVAISIGSMVQASPATTLTLNNAIDKTLEQNPQLYQYRFIKDALRANRLTSQLSPPIALDVEMEDFSGSGAKQRFDETEFTLALSVEIERLVWI